ncbi:hypothetical protein JCM1840_000420 [Sporobolomyces johnsonii]
MDPTTLWEHTFTWEGQAEDVIVTGSFDSWSSSVKLEQTAPSCFAATTRLSFGERVDYKFVVDGQWQHSPSQQHEWDASGNLNNVLHVPVLALPPVEAQGFGSGEGRDGVEEWRNVRIGHWDGEKTRLLAALYPSPTLTFQTLRRTVLPRLVDLSRLPGRGYRFAQERELVEEGEQSRLPVAEGDYTLISTDPIPALSRLALPRPLPHPEPASAAFTPQPSAHGFLFSPRLPAAPPSEPDLDEHAHDEDDEQQDAGERTLRHSPSLGSLDAEGDGFEDARCSFSSYSHSRTPSLVVSASADEDEDEDDDEWEAQSDATFSTALSAISYSHWLAHTSSLGGGRGGGVRGDGGGGGGAGGFTSGGHSSGALEVEPPREDEGEGEGEGHDSFVPVAAAAALGPLSPRADSSFGSLPVAAAAAALPISRAVSRALSAAPLMAREEHTVVAPLPESLDEPLWTAGDHEGGEVAVEKVEEVARAFKRGEWVLDPCNGFQPLALHPAAQVLLPFIRPAPALLSSAPAPAPGSSGTPTGVDPKKDDDAAMTDPSDEGEQYLPTPPASPLGLHSTVPVPLAPAPAPAAASTTTTLKIHPSHHHPAEAATTDAGPALDETTRQDLKLRGRVEDHVGGAIARWVVVGAV